MTNKFCPFCDATCDPIGWLRNDGVRGPECNGCGATADSIDKWNTRTPIPMLLFCPKCHWQHVDAPGPDPAWTNPPHKSHLCHKCGTIWRPADVETVGVLDIVTCGENDNWQRPGWPEAGR